MKNDFIKISELLDQGKNIVLARIIKQSGSAPRSIGTRCIVLEDGTLIGTIGGGLLEYKVLAAARVVFEQKKSSFLHIELTGKDAASSDMICGGIVDIYLEMLCYDHKNSVEAFHLSKEIVVKGGQAIMLTSLADGADCMDDSQRMLVKPDAVIGHIPGVSDKSKSWLKITRPQNVQIAPDRYVFAEPVKRDPELYLFGAGHVSVCAAHMAKVVGFRVIVIDDRDAFANSERFPEADKIIALPFDEVFKKVKMNSSSYIAIVTRGHIFDKEVLTWALGTEAVYIGMIGSSDKRKAIFKALIAEGFGQSQLDRVHSPIGLAIGAETPEEISVSIISELIKIKAELTNA